MRASIKTSKNINKNIELFLRYALPFCVGIMLTFMRGGMLFFAEKITLFDRIINIFVVFTALVLFFRSMKAGYRIKEFYHYWPIIIFLIWVFIRGVLFDFGCVINKTTLISLFVAVVLSFNIRRHDLFFLRRSLVVINIFFIAMVIIYAPYALSDLSGSNLGVDYRLGGEKPAALVAYPRSLYTLAIACIGSAIIEKNIIIKIVAFIISFVPIFIGFSTAGRGGLLGFIAGMTVIVIGVLSVYGKKRKLWMMIMLMFLIGLVYFLYSVLDANYPLFIDRIVNDDDSGRFYIWREVLGDISFFGEGILINYPHNIFLESLRDYGIVGLLLFVYMIAMVIINAIKSTRKAIDIEVFIVLSIVMLQIVAQQFSLNMYWAFFWTAIILPMSINIKDSKDTCDHRIKSQVR